MAVPLRGLRRSSRVVGLPGSTATCRPWPRWSWRSISWAPDLGTRRPLGRVRSEERAAGAGRLRPIPGWLTRSPVQFRRVDGRHRRFARTGTDLLRRWTLLAGSRRAGDRGTRSPIRSPPGGSPPTDTRVRFGASAGPSDSGSTKPIGQRDRVRPAWPVQATGTAEPSWLTTPVGRAASASSCPAPAPAPRPSAPRRGRVRPPAACRGPRSPRVRTLRESPTRSAVPARPRRP